ncbi:MAG: hypothetical protein UX85_C0001G0167 [Candidatus Beckwithbacteria bacterium GW2011_GWB1_47_15]|uniref:CxxC-x17-CxxC domain-containing protein n=1 Tax=Candidatus Beckwithbacteria bacterium GW2011_GWB1_47_15 TaxID=1618371 RepID=A0A0G1U6W6_9BACT|nr:MAG: hypothetical protein UY43_C0001G0959 [Candidatus Beckwithbacteria bacterium GW2011_GWC1_49_16]AQS30804.1 hypothetical protein [uncultured bacterium]KKU35989.1 MAG: hypothetical protein UX50_C0001G0166 [Candidatus Beckwithbacteria bacterium GW2011_GWA1_46_30]KKU61953.1 MAG: hypothetical protein UX85_C0001G0167 [Candidatus Beckwithbacteria bacterium GW2011_GWB1_47_15]KKU72493.1 MAG: hypothetical protein UX97_C0001G0363 [Candidatus Beckwithbacteria bacterium GW2011_GWA2_47_25]KKW04340.1 M
MRDFNRGRGGGSRGGGGRGGPGGGRFGGGDFRREMHPAVCSNCGKDCEVPFRPTGDKPVFCNDCFRKDSGDSQPRGGGRFNRDGRTPQRSGPNYQDHFDAINQKLDHLLELVSAMKKPKVKKKEPADLE